MGEKKEKKYMMRNINMIAWMHFGNFEEDELPCETSYTGILFILTISFRNVTDRL